MKILVLLLSVGFTFLSGCRDGTGETEKGSNNDVLSNYDSQDDENHFLGEHSDNTGSSSTGDVETTEDVDTESPPPPDSPSAPPPDSSSAPPARLPYTGQCRDIEECSKKYSECLSPLAGEPHLTETVTCTNIYQPQPDIRLVLREWNLPGGQNKLLCDLFINDTLETFATNTGDHCKNTKEKEKRRYINLGYTCQ